MIRKLLRYFKIVIPFFIKFVKSPSWDRPGENVLTFGNIYAPYVSKHKLTFSAYLNNLETIPKAQLVKLFFFLAVLPFYLVV